VGVKGSLADSSLKLRALLFSTDGSQSLDDEYTAPIALDSDLGKVAAAAAALGVSLGQRMIDRGARELIGS
jgi:hypothetical protein